MPDRPIYSGYSVWRSIINKKQETIKTYLGPKYHVVAYPINDHQVSIVAAVKTDKEYKESWKVEGTLDELREDLSMPDIDIPAPWLLMVKDFSNITTGMFADFKMHPSVRPDIPAPIIATWFE